MKNLNTIIKLMLIFSLWGLGGFGYAQTSTDSLLCRSWQVDWEATYDAMGTENQTKYLALPEAQQSRIQNTLSTQVYTFANDGTLTLDWQSNETAQHQSLTWQREAMQLSIMLNGLTKIKNIRTLTAEKLVLEGQDTRELFPILHFTPYNE